MLKYFAGLLSRLTTLNQKCKASSAVLLNECCCARRSLGQNPGLCQVQRYGSQVGVPVTTNFTYPPYYVDPCNPAAGPAAAPALAPGENFRSCPCIKGVLRLHTGKDLDASLVLWQDPCRFQVASRLARARLCAVLRSVSPLLSQGNPGPRSHF